MQIKTEGSNLVLKIPRDLISRDYVERFIERIELEMLVKKNQMTDKEAEKLSERIKENWWKENRDRVLKRVKMSNVKAQSSNQTQNPNVKRNF